jgi:hypothetical protein
MNAEERRGRLCRCASPRGPASLPRAFVYIDSDNGDFSGWEWPTARGDALCRGRDGLGHCHVVPASTYLT